MKTLATALPLLLLVVLRPAEAQTLDLGGLAGGLEGSTVGYIIQMFGLLTILSLAPGILIMVTSFTRFIIAFSILRAGMGLPTTPANLILISLALFMTFYVMSPTFDRAWNEGVQPLINEEISRAGGRRAHRRPLPRLHDQQCAREGFRPLHRSRARARRHGCLGREPGSAHARPAFMISEIRRGFEIGFLIVLPFLVIDLIVATITMSMGMMMLPPTVVSLPFKVLFFVLIDGWNLLVGSLVRSFV
jgi:flagellar biosynthesis protein FliP